MTDDEVYELLARTGQNRPCPHCDQHQLVADLAVGLGSLMNMIEANRDVAVHRFEEALAKMPAPFRRFLDRTVSKAREDQTVTIDMDEAFRTLEGRNGSE